MIMAKSYRLAIICSAELEHVERQWTTATWQVNNQSIAINFRQMRGHKQLEYNWNMFFMLQL